MFVDLNWPLNASSLLSASAELLVFIFGKLTEWRCFVTYLSNDPRIIWSIFVSMPFNAVQCALHNPTSRTQVQSEIILQQTYNFHALLSPFFRWMEVAVTTGARRRVPISSQIVTINKPTSNFLQGGCRSCHPTNSVKALKGKQLWCASRCQNRPVQATRAGLQCRQCWSHLVSRNFFPVFPSEMSINANNFSLGLVG